MDKTDFDYVLPEARIAQAPLAERSASRLLCLDRTDGTCRDRYIRDLTELLGPGDLLIFNDTRVLAARLHGHKTTGGAVEVMLERILAADRISAKIRANKPPRPGTQIIIGQFELVVTAREGELYHLRLDSSARLSDLLAEHGHMPLPPYIRRDDTTSDRSRYQTVWARHDGAVAAPTAGLHFDDALLAALAERGVRFAYVTLHVGSGTYQRLREGDLANQRLHAERVYVSDETCQAVAQTRAAGGRVIAVGTTAIRSLETAARAGGGQMVPYADETELFIKPGDVFHVVDGVITNFHEPQSSLLMLIAAFAGREAVLAAYAHAVAEDYRFLSYGDAMFIA